MEGLPIERGGRITPDEFSEDEMETEQVSTNIYRLLNRDSGSKVIIFTRKLGVSLHIQLGNSHAVPLLALYPVLLHSYRTREPFVGSQ